MNKLQQCVDYLRNDDNNVKILNYMLFIYLFFVLVSQRYVSSVFVLMLLVFLFNQNFKERILFALSNKVVQAFIAYFLIHILWIFGSENLDIAIYQLKLNLILLYPILFVAIIRDDFIKYMINIFLFIMFVSSLWSFFMYFDVLHSPFQVCHASIPFLYKSDYGFFLFVAIAYIAFRLANFNDGYRIKLLLCFLIVLFSLNIFISGSRSYMLGYILAILVIAVLIYRHKFKMIIYWFSSSILLFAIMYFSSQNIQQQINNIFDGFSDSLLHSEYNGSSGARVGMIVYSIPVIKENLIFGVGAGDHVPTVIKEITSDIEFINNPEKFAVLLGAMQIGKSSYLHNTYIQTLVQFGLLGFIVFMNLFYQLIKYKQQNIIYKNLIVFIVIMYLFTCFSGAELMFNNLGKFFVLFISLLIVQKVTDRNLS